MLNRDSKEFQEILNDFYLESTELIEKIDQDLLSLEKSPDDADLINRIFRSFHTLKGMASFLGFEQITKLAHHSEEVLNKFRKSEIKASTQHIDTLLKAVDIIKNLIAYIKDNKQEIKTDLSGILQELGCIGLEKRAEKEVHKKIGELLVESSLVTKEQVAEALEKQVEEPKLGEILIREGLISEEQLQGTLEKQRYQYASQQTIRVEVSRLEILMNLVGELVLGRNRLLRLNADIVQRFPGDRLLEELQETSTRLSKITTDLQSAVMKTRLIPISNIFNKCPRMVRDLSRKANKEIDLQICGEDTELDKSVIEEIHDPLIHLLRNSVDHGIEYSEERRKRGKPSLGKIILKSYYEGNQVVIEIEDDGQGIDPEILKKKAVEKGLISQADSSQISHKEALDLIFIPGFSTASSITKISGRGVGMDVVRSNIQRLNGLISLDSKVGVGTKILLKIPLTLAIIQALIIKIGQEIFALPLTFVHEIIRANSVQMRTIEHKEIIQFRGDILPLVRLHTLFDLPFSEEERRYIVIVGFSEKRLGFMISKVIGQEELVIKSAASYTKTNLIGGASIMGDGRVVFIIDVPSVINSQLNVNSQFKGR